MSWKELRTSVKNCPFTDCLRNNKAKLPILFDRMGNHSPEIKFLVVSQEPGASLKNKYSSSKEIEEFLISECVSKCTPKNKVGLPYKVREIFNKSFNLTTDEIYWTHALKCVPGTDRDISKQWEKCSYFCVEYFKNELNLIPSKKLAIIIFGNYALALCRHVLEDKQLNHTEGIIKYIKTTDPKKRFSFGEKEISLFPFIHPAHREQVLKQHDKNNKVKKSVWFLLAGFVIILLV